MTTESRHGMLPYIMTGFFYSLCRDENSNMASEAVPDDQKELERGHDVSGNDDDCPQVEILSKIWFARPNISD